MDPNEKDALVVQQDDLYGKKTVAVPKPEKQIGIDTHNTIYSNIIDGTENSTIDITALNNFTNLSQNRETIYQLLDIMSEDSTISAVLETYAEDSTITNDQGRIMWVESQDANVSKYITYLLDSMNIDKNAYKWIYSLCKYGDLYLKLFRQSDFKDDLFDNREKDKKLNEEYEKKILNEAFNAEEAKEAEKDLLKEDLIVKAYAPNDRIVNYVEMEPNPAELFELTRFGKSYAYIQAPTTILTTQNNQSLINTYMNYQFKKNDVNIYNATCFVHAALEDNSSRIPEKVEIFKSEAEDGTETSATYTVKRGQSILYSAFKAWRELMLLENSLLLNRLTRSSITRILGIEVGDMPKEQVGQLLSRVKQMIEQKSSINVGNSFTEYTNPGPSENIVYVPTHGGIGNITATDLGGEVNPGTLNDIEYFKDKLFGSLKVPKQFFGQVGDDAGFSGGESLSIISARYAKSIKRIQNTFIQAITDAINLMLLDKGMANYVNKFALKMVPPITKEDLDRREYKDSQIGTISQFMGLFSFEDESASLKMLKSLLENVMDNPEVMDVLDEQIEKAEQKEAEIAEEIAENPEEAEDTYVPDLAGGDFGDLDDLTAIAPEEAETSTAETATVPETNTLPTPAELGAGDFTNTAEM